MSYLDMLDSTEVSHGESMKAITDTIAKNENGRVVHSINSKDLQSYRWKIFKGRIFHQMIVTGISIWVYNNSEVVGEYDYVVRMIALMSISVAIVYLFSSFAEKI